MIDYGFDMFSNKLYEALTAYPPDFKLAQQYINEGADIHARSKDDDGENILAQIILGYSCLCCIGETINQVLAKTEPITTFIDEILPSKEIILCDQELYLICGEKPLRINNYAEGVIDPRDINNPELIDVSAHFFSIIGSKIKNILFPDFSEKSNGIPSPNFVLQLTDDRLIQCSSYRIDAHWQLVLHLVDRKKNIQNP